VCCGVIGVSQVVMVFLSLSGGPVLGKVKRASQKETKVQAVVKIGGDGGHIVEVSVVGAGG